MQEGQATKTESLLAELAEKSALAEYDGPVHRLIGLVEASCFARMSVGSGRTVDRARLISILALLSDHLAENEEQELADAFTGEGIAHLDVLADQGEEIVDNNMTLVAENATPSALQAAKTLKKIWEKNSAESA